MNVLLTSAGRRTYMAEYFRAALQGGGLVYAGNSQECPAMQAADRSVLTPLIYDAGYVPFLLGFCREHRIDLIVPLFDIDLPVLANSREAFAAVGTVLAVSDSGMLSACSDKYIMSARLSDAGLFAPDTAVSMEKAIERIRDGHMTWPLIVKPRFGMGSIGVLKAYDETELQAAYAMCEREIRESYLKYESAACPGNAVLMQPRIRGQEYGLDVICDLEGHYVTTLVRKKLGMRSGETDEAVVLGEADPEYAVLSETGARIAAYFRPRGLIDADILMDPGTQKPYIIDMNARFGGGYPFSHLAGADVPKAYILWMQHRDAEAREACLRIRPGTHGYKDINPRRWKNQ